MSTLIIALSGVIIGYALCGMLTALEASRLLEQVRVKDRQIAAMRRTWNG